MDAEISAIEHRMRRSLTQDFLPLALQVLASALAVAPPESGRYLRTALVQQTALLESLVRLLGMSFLHKNAGRQGRVEKLASSAGSTSVSSGEAAPPPGPVAVAPVDLDRLRECVRLALQLLGNLVYSCDSAKVRGRNRTSATFINTLIWYMLRIIMCVCLGRLADVGCPRCGAVPLRYRLREPDLPRVGAAVCAQRLRGAQRQPGLHPGAAAPGGQHPGRQAALAGPQGGDECADRQVQVRPHRTHACCGHH